MRRRLYRVLLLGLALAALEEGAASAELIREAIGEWLDRRKRSKRGR